MNNKPVALMTEYGIQPLYESALQEGQFLYTHPIKELTDEEITAIAKEIFNNYKNFHHYQIDFARAILRKAQEK